MMGVNFHVPRPRFHPGTHPWCTAQLSAHKTIATVNLNFNRLCPPACEALLPGLCDPADPAKPHPRLTRVIVDAGLVGISPELHERLNVEGGGGKKGGKKGKKKK